MCVCVSACVCVCLRACLYVCGFYFVTRAMSVNWLDKAALCECRELTESGQGLVPECGLAVSLVLQRGLVDCLVPQCGLVVCLVPQCGLVVCLVPQCGLVVALVPQCDLVPPCGLVVSQVPQCLGHFSGSSVSSWSLWFNSMSWRSV